MAEKVESDGKKADRLTRITDILIERLPSASKLQLQVAARAVIAAYPDPPAKRDADKKPLPLAPDDAVQLHARRDEMQEVVAAIEMLANEHFDHWPKAQAIARALRAQGVVR